MNRRRSRCKRWNRCAVSFSLRVFGKRRVSLDGVPRMRERPQAALFDALRELGYRIESPNNKLPAVIYGAGPRPGKCRVNIEKVRNLLRASAFIWCWRVENRGGWKK